MLTVLDVCPDVPREIGFQPTDNPSPRALTADQIAQFNTQGFVGPLPLLDPAEVCSQSDYFEGLLAEARRKGYPDAHLNGWHRFCRGVYDLATRPRLLDYVEDLMGPDIVLRHTHFFCKLPHDPLVVPWHQDESHWPLTPTRAISAWIALDDANVDNGCMLAVPASHLSGHIPILRRDPQKTSVLDQDVEHPERYGGPPVALALRAGEVVLFSGLLLHSSGPNRTALRRCALSARYVPPSVRAAKGWNRDGPSVCRGSDPSGHWPPSGRPQGEDVPPHANARSAEP